MGEWKTYRLGDLCSRIKSGKGIPASEVSTTGEYPVIGGNGIRGYTNTSNFNGVCAVVGRQGAYCGNVRFFSGEAYMTEHAVVIVGNELADTRYLAYLLSIMQLGHLSAQSAQPGLSVQTLSKLSINIPDISTQRRIAGILGSLDDKIELNRRINANLEAQAQALFRSWFVDFEPFRDGPFVDSELGKIPQGWKVISLSELMNYAGGSQPPASEFINSYKDGYVRFIQIRDYASESHVTYIPISSKNKTCDIRDIMIARYGASLGRICYGLKGAYNVALAKVLPVKPYYREFLRSYLSSDYFYQSINMKGNRAVQAGFNQSDINSFRLNFPKDESIIQTYDKVCSQFLNKRLQVLDEIKSLSALRDTLLPKLMAGEIAIE